MGNRKKNTEQNAFEVFGLIPWEKIALLLLFLIAFSACAGTGFVVLGVFVLLVGGDFASALFCTVGVAIGIWLTREVLLEIRTGHKQGSWEAPN